LGSFGCLAMIWGPCEKQTNAQQTQFKTWNHKEQAARSCKKKAAQST